MKEGETLMFSDEPTDGVIPEQEVSEQLKSLQTMFDNKTDFIPELKRVWDKRSGWTFHQLMEFLRLKAVNYQRDNGIKTFLKDEDFLKMLKGL